QHLRLIHSELCDLLREGSQVLQNVGVAIGLTDPILSPSSFDPDENSWRVRLMDTLEVQQRRICNEQGGYFNIRDGIFVHIYPYLLSERQKLCLVWLESIGLRGGAYQLSLIPSLMSVLLVSAHPSAQLRRCERHL